MGMSNLIAVRNWIVSPKSVALHPRLPKSSQASPYLFLWAGDADAKNSDFLAVIDARSESKSYRKSYCNCANQRDGHDAAPYAVRISEQRDFVCQWLGCGSNLSVYP